MDGKPKNEANKLAAKGYVLRLLIALAVISRKSGASICPGLLFQF